MALPIKRIEPTGKPVPYPGGGRYLNGRASVRFCAYWNRLLGEGRIVEVPSSPVPMLTMPIGSEVSDG